MHGRIFQITKKQVERKNYLNEDTLVQGDGIFIDYCVEISEKEREQSIACLVDEVLPKGMFTRLGANILRYNGDMEQWKEQAIANIHEKLTALTPEKFFWGSRFYDLKEAVVNPLNTCFLFYTDSEGEQSITETSYDFMFYVSGLEAGTLLYIGGVIDYHF